jgi:hypothetical protein
VPESGFVVRAGCVMRIARASDVVVGASLPARSTTVVAPCGGHCVAEVKQKVCYVKARTKDHRNEESGFRKYVRIKQMNSNEGCIGTCMY